MGEPTKKTARRRERQRAAIGLLAASLCLLAAIGCGSSEPTATPPPETDSTAAPEAVETSSLATAEGFVVWESNRSGDWRLWISDLSGVGARQLTPDERRRRHCCPHIAPGGSSVAYVSLPTGRARYLDEDAVGELRLIDPDGRATRGLAEVARTYFEHRAAVWIDDASLHYIAGDGSVQSLDIESGASETVLAETGDLSRRWLVDASGRWAATGRGALAPIRNGRLQAETPLPGCQPYFSRDGRWGYWTAGAGGPIDRFDLASGETATILRKNDSRLPAGRGYLYFPMLSSDGTLLAFAASDGEHDHHRADYDIFVGEVDPATLELVGTPWVVAPHPGVDRFPDLWRPATASARTVVAEPAAPPSLRSVWPARTYGLLWSWSAASEGPTTELRQAGAPVDRREPLELALGAVVATDSATLLHEGLQRTNQLSLELVFTPPARANKKFAAIIAIGRDSSRENLVLAQRGERLILRMRVGRKGPGAYAEADLGPLLASHRVHLVISYSPGRTIVFRDGREALKSRDLRGHFFQWRPYALTVGDRGRGGAAWPGRIEALAIYDRPASASEVRRNADLVADNS